MIDFKWIAAPLVGGLIGLITNGIAIRMLFHPFRPVRIGRFTLPFTPGLIPKEQPRIAKAIGKVIGDKLLDTDTLQKALTSEELHGAFDRKVNRIIENLGREDGTVYAYLERRGYHLPVETAVDYVSANAAAFVTERLVEEKIGGMILEYAIQEVVSNLNSMLARVAEPAIRKSQGAIAGRIDEVILEKCPGIIESYIGAEYEKWRDLPMKEAAALLWQKKEPFKERTWELYCRIVEERADRFLAHLDVSVIVEQRINEFDMRELEALILEISRKELNTLVWIGGLLGMLIGFVNVLF